MQKDVLNNKLVFTVENDYKTITHIDSVPVCYYQSYVNNNKSDHLYSFGKDNEYDYFGFVKLTVGSDNLCTHINFKGRTINKKQVMHRVDGPASIYFKNNGNLQQTYYLDNVKLTKQEWLNKTANLETTTNTSQSEINLLKLQLEALQNIINKKELATLIEINKLNDKIAQQNEMINKLINTIAQQYEQINKLINTIKELQSVHNVIYN